MKKPNALKLLEDRIEFKFHAADHYLKCLENLKSKGKTPRNANVGIEWEMITENLLFHLLGAMDALLVRINEKFELCIKSRDLKVKTVHEELEKKRKLDLLKEASNLLDRNQYPQGSWFYDLNELRNIATHRSILNLNFSSSSYNGDHNCFVLMPLSYPVQGYL